MRRVRWMAAAAIVPVMMIDVPANAADPFETRTRVMAAIQGHVIGKAVYMGLFHRPE